MFPLVFFACLAVAVGCARSRGSRVSKICFTGTEGVELQATITQKSDYTGIERTSFHAAVPTEQSMLGSTIKSVHVRKISESGDLNMIVLENGTMTFQGSASGTNRVIDYVAE
jgi:hypothetical protein